MSGSSSLNWDKYWNVINGELESTKESRHSINPATGNSSVDVPVATREDVDRAIESAAAAFKKWSRVQWAERRRAIEAFGDALEAEKEHFSQLLTKEQGKPVRCFHSDHIFTVSSC